MLRNTNYNPDVLSCLANLSNDEVFMPPSLVNQKDLLEAPLDLITETALRPELRTFIKSDMIYI